jgi:hypothetical protein
MARRQFCRELLAGKCYRGEFCRFRHHGPERPSGTVFACELVPKAQDVCVSGYSVTFTSGAMPIAIKPVDSLETGLCLELLTTSLEISWYQSTHNSWLSFETEAAARNAAEILNGLVTRGSKLAATVKASGDGKTWTTQVSNVPEAVDPEHIHSLLPSDLVKPTKTTEGSPAYEPTIPQIDILRELIESSCSMTVTKSGAPFMSESSTSSKYRARFELDTVTSLAPLVQTLDSCDVAEFGGTRIFAVERLFALLSMSGPSYAKHARYLKRAAHEASRNHHVVVKIDDSTPEPPFRYQCVPRRENH